MLNLLICRRFLSYVSLTLLLVSNSIFADFDFVLSVVNRTGHSYWISNVSSRCGGIPGNHTVYPRGGQANHVIKTNLAIFNTGTCNNGYSHGVIGVYRLPNKKCVSTVKWLQYKSGLHWNNMMEPADDKIGIDAKKHPKVIPSSISMDQITV